MNLKTAMQNLKFNNIFIFRFLNFVLFNEFENAMQTFLFNEDQLMAVIEIASALTV